MLFPPPPDKSSDSQGREITPRQETPVRIQVIVSRDMITKEVNFLTLSGNEEPRDFKTNEEVLDVVEIELGNEDEVRVMKTLYKMGEVSEDVLLHSRKYDCINS